jgi:5-oxoprolinase (ATP-hydrolysing) subunit B
MRYRGMVKQSHQGATSDGGTAHNPKQCAAVKPLLRTLGLDACDIQVAERPDPTLSRRIGAWCATLREHPSVRDAVPGLIGAVIHWTPDLNPTQRDDLALATWADAVPMGQGRLHTVPVTFNGPDLNEVATRIGLSNTVVINLMCERALVIACIGFLPGFPYLLGLDPRINVPRRASPRSRVVAGSVAVSAGMAGIYPTTSPGGWHCLGLCDPAQCAHFEAGDRIQFTIAERT